MRTLLISTYTALLLVLSTSVQPVSATPKSAFISSFLFDKISDCGKTLGECTKNLGGKVERRNDILAYLQNAKLMDSKIPKIKRIKGGRLQFGEGPTAVVYSSEGAKEFSINSQVILMDDKTKFATLVDLVQKATKNKTSLYDYLIPKTYAQDASNPGVFAAIVHYSVDGLATSIFGCGPEILPPERMGNCSTFELADGIFEYTSAGAGKWLSSFKCGANKRFESIVVNVNGVERRYVPHYVQVDGVTKRDSMKIFEGDKNTCSYKFNPTGSIVTAQGQEKYCESPSDESWHFPFFLDGCCQQGEACLKELDRLTKSKRPIGETLNISTPPTGQ